MELKVRIKKNERDTQRLNRDVTRENQMHEEMVVTFFFVTKKLCYNMKMIGQEN